MREVALEIELLSDAVLPVSAATSGPRECLGYIPGSTLLGVAAARLYSELGDDAFLVFHSGRVRFLPAYPLGGDGSRSVPIPRSYHRAKRPASWHDRDHLPETPVDDLLNLAVVDPHGQYSGLKSGYLTTSGILFEPERRVMLKTAIDPSSGRVAEGQLFSYEALCRGTRLLAFIHADDDVAASILEMVVAALCRGTVALGRSRSAEFGRARIRRLEQPPAPIPRADRIDERVFLLAFSDLALVEPESCTPTLVPRPEHFGLAGGEIDWLRSQVRTRRYSPINGKRQRPDLERQVIEAGSVIVIDPPPDTDFDTLSARLAGGVGAYRAEGLGQVLLQPKILLLDRPYSKERGAAPKSAETAAPADDLVTWLGERQEMREQRERAWSLATRWDNDLAKHVCQTGAPSKSAWAFIAQQAALAGSRNELITVLFGASGEKDGLLRQGVRQAPWKSRHGGNALVDRLQELLGGETEVVDQELLLAVRILADLVMKRLARSRRAG